MARDASGSWRQEYQHQGVPIPDGGGCPECGSGRYSRQGGCAICLDCGYSPCHGRKA